MLNGVEEQERTLGGTLWARWTAALTNAATAAGPPLLFGVRLWASVSLALHVAFWLQLDDPFWAGTSAAIVCQPYLGASLRKGWYRMLGTIIGAVAIVVLTACFPQYRAPFLVTLALWAAGCALAATLLRNFAAYAAALAGYTAVIVASDELGATGGPNANEVFLLAVTRASEICIGIVCAGAILAGSDLGGARRRLLGLFAALSAEITGRFIGMLALAGPDLPETQPIRRGLLRRVIALDPVIDHAIGESAEIRYHSPLLQIAMDGLFAALAAWRTIAIMLPRLPDEKARQEAHEILLSIPQELRAAERGVPPDWLADPVRIREICGIAVQTLVTLQVATPSQRLLADQTARALAGISAALNGLALLAAAFAQPRMRGHGLQIRVPDWLPSLVNAARTFVTIGAVTIFWILTEWPNGATAIAFTAIAILLFAPRADQAYASAIEFAAGAALGAVFSAILKFVVLRRLESFEAFSLVMAVYLIPAGALMAQPRYTAMFTSMTVFFSSIIQATNEMSYDLEQYCNNALAIVAGLGAAALSFRLLPPPSPAFRTRRLLALTLRDLRRLAAGRASWIAGNWENHMYGRLEALPDEAQPAQRAQLLAALSVGTETIRLRRIAGLLGLGSDLAPSLEALAQGKSAVAVTRFAGLDDRLASVAEPAASLALQARACILVITEAIIQHASYFDA